MLICNQNRDKKGVYVSGLQTTNFTTITRAKLNFGLWVMGVFAVWKAQKKKHYLGVAYFRICARCTPSFLCWSFEPTFWPSRGVAVAMNRWKPVRSFFLWYNPFCPVSSNDHLLISPGTISLVHSLKSADFDSSHSSTELLNDLRKVRQFIGVFYKTFAGGGAVVKSLKRLFQ